MINVLMGMFIVLGFAPAMVAGSIPTGRIISFDSIIQGRSPQEAFDTLIQENNVVIDFYADWCGPCQELGRIMHDVAPKFPNVAFVKINVDRYDSIGDRYGIRSIPTLLFFRDNSLVSRSSGTTTKAKLSATLTTIYPN